MMMWSLIVAGLLAAAPDVEVQTLDGQAIAGPLLGLTEQKVTLQTAAGPAALDTEKLSGLSPKVKPSATQQAAVWLELVDGTQLVGQEFSVKEGRVRLSTPAGPVEFPTRDVAWARLQAETEALGPQWTRIVEGKIDADILVVRKEQSLDYHRGVLGDVTAETVGFELDGEKVPVKRPKVYGVIYRHPAGRELPAARCLLVDAEGSRWMVRDLALEGDKLRWTTPAGVEAAMAVASVAKIDFSEGKIVYLSDLKPESVRWTPFFGTADKVPALAEFYAPRQDRALEPRPLKLAGKEYAKGLALHSRTEVVYRLPRAFRRFTAVAGIDDRVRPAGDVQLVIRADDKVLFDETINGAEPPKTLDLDVTGARRITVLVDFGKDLDVGDHLDLCEARVIR